MSQIFTRAEIESQLQRLDKSTEVAAVVDAMIIRQLLGTADSTEKA